MHYYFVPANTAFASDASRVTPATPGAILGTIIVVVNTAGAGGNVRYSDDGGVTSRLLVPGTSPVGVYHYTFNAFAKGVAGWRVQTGTGAHAIVLVPKLP